MLKIYALLFKKINLLKIKTHLNSATYFGQRGLPEKWLVKRGTFFRCRMRGDYINDGIGV
jgi:hypothetical protein